MTIEFEPTSSFCYNFARYVVLPEIDKLPEVQAGEPFRMVDHVKAIINNLLTPEQQTATFNSRDSGKLRSVAQGVKWYSSFVAKNSNIFVDLGQGLFRSKIGAEISEEELDEEALESGDEELGESRGWIYAFSFPSIVKTGTRFPIKVGKTIHEVESRVMDQCKGSAAFENPVILGRWQVKRITPTELAIHNILKARGHWRKEVPGKEWFDTTIEEIESILRFLSEE